MESTIVTDFELAFAKGKELTLLKIIKQKDFAAVIEKGPDYVYPFIEKAIKYLWSEVAEYLTAKLETYLRQEKTSLDRIKVFRQQIMAISWGVTRTEESEAW